MINQLNPKFNLPSDKKLRQNIIPKMYRRVYQNVEMIISGFFDFCSIITDIWPLTNMHILINARLNLTDNDWKPKMVASQCFPIDESHTLEHIVDVLGK